MHTLTGEEWTIKNSPRAISEAMPRIRAALSRTGRWEFWPSSLLYLPLLPWIVAYACRYGGVMRFTCANPAIPFGGFVGESKHDILMRFPDDVVARSVLVRPGPRPLRVEQVIEFMRTRGLRWPIIVKPDVGERGTGVRLVRNQSELIGVLCSKAALIAQEYHPGPFEVGVFYVRFPGADRGMVYSVTNKVFPTVVGDGTSTIRELIWCDDRLRLQAGIFLRRLGRRADIVPIRGKVVRLAVAGNHCRGTMFQDGADLATPALEAALDRITSSTPGIHFGRFDLRFAHVEALRRGEGFSIIEFNGVLSESTNIYDPRHTFWHAQRILREQWRLAFAIGDACTRRGVVPPSAIALIREVITHFSRPGAADDSD